MTQFKNKLRSIIAAFKKRSQLMHTGNGLALDLVVIAAEGDSDTNGSDDTNPPPRRSTYSEMAADYFEDKEDRIETGTCDPFAESRKYRDYLGTEPASLWPLLCDCFSGQPGYTGEAIIESSANVEETESISDDDGTVQEARDRVKRTAKTRKEIANAAKRLVDVFGRTLKTGFERIERVMISNRTPQTDVSTTELEKQSEDKIERAIAALSRTVEVTSERQQASIIYAA
ncbi:hypothetical protein FI667_g10559, partial [Globisporangium splendens]